MRPDRKKTKSVQASNPNIETFISRLESINTLSRKAKNAIRHRLSSRSESDIRNMIYTLEGYLGKRFDFPIRIGGWNNGKKKNAVEHRLNGNVQGGLLLKKQKKL